MRLPRRRRVGPREGHRPGLRAAATCPTWRLHSSASSAATPLHRARRSSRLRCVRRIARRSGPLTSSACATSAATRRSSSGPGWNALDASSPCRPLRSRGYCDAVARVAATSGPLWLSPADSLVGPVASSVASGTRSRPAVTAARWLLRGRIGVAAPRRGVAPHRAHARSLTCSRSTARELLGSREHLALGCDALDLGRVERTSARLSRAAFVLGGTLLALGAGATRLRDSCARSLAALIARADRVAALCVRSCADVHCPRCSCCFADAPLGVVRPRVGLRPCSGRGSHCAVSLARGRVISREPVDADARRRRVHDRLRVLVARLDRVLRRASRARPSSCSSRRDPERRRRDRFPPVLQRGAGDPRRRQPVPAERRAD